jgi:hypothetical protein
MSPHASDATNFADEKPAHLVELFQKAYIERRYDEARLAYSRSSKPFMAARILEDLYTTAIKQQNFKDAAYLCYQMAHVVLQVLAAP